MTKHEQSAASPLVAAATALEEELRRLSAVAREAQRLPLDSQRNIERTAEKLGELGGVDERVGPLVQRLMGAVADLVQSQQRQGEALAARAEELRARREVLRALLDRYQELGRGAQQLNGLVQAFAAGARPGAEPGAEPPSYEAVRDTMSGLITRAEEMSRAAGAEGFGDLAGQADALRQQLLAARNKLGLLSARAGAAGRVQ